MYCVYKCGFMVWLYFNCLKMYVLKVNFNSKYKNVFIIFY